MLGSEDFARLTEPFRPELLAHCYRMLGSIYDAEDQVQETLVRAWRSYSDFQGRSSLRTWLYRIATNACLRAIENRARRPLPSGLGGPGEDPAGPLAPVMPEVRWLQPVPDALIRPGPADPATVAVYRESVRLALIAALQYLPGRQRAVLILRDVLGWHAAEVGERTLLDAYAEAFASADVGALARLLRDDAVLEMPPQPTWFAGRERVSRFLASRVLTEPGAFAMLPIAANGQPAFAAYLRGNDGVYRAHAIQVLTSDGAAITRIVSFNDAGLYPIFALPGTMPAPAGS